MTNEIENIEIFTTEDDNILKTYGLNAAQILLFRNGRYILYSAQGNSMSETFVDWIKENIERNTYELSDSNFEHDTQASISKLSENNSNYFFQIVIH